MLSKVIVEFLWRAWCFNPAHLESCDVLYTSSIISPRKSYCGMNFDCSSFWHAQIIAWGPFICFHTSISEFCWLLFRCMSDGVWFQVCVLTSTQKHFERPSPFAIMLKESHKEWIHVLSASLILDHLCFSIYPRLFQWWDRRNEASARKQATFTCF
jgi:hypothetical protein